MAREFPRPLYSGDYLVGNLIVTPSGRLYSGSAPSYFTIETLDVPGGLVKDNVYEAVFLGDLVVTPTTTVSLRLGAFYGKGSLSNAAVLFEASWTLSGPIPAIVAPFVCPDNYDSVQFAVQLQGIGSVAYGSAPGGLLFGVKPVGTTSNISIIST